MIEYLAAAGPWAFKGAMGIAWCWGGVKTLDYLLCLKYVTAIKGVLKYTPGIKWYKFNTQKKIDKRREVHFAINHGLTEKEMDSLEPRISTALNCPVECVINKGRLIVCIYPLGIPTRLKYPSDEFFKEYDCHCIWPAGLSCSDWVVLDLADGPHLLIGGITGKGKSVIINQALYANIAYHGEKVERYLIDFKYGIEANKFSKHVLVADDIEAALPICAGLVRDMEKRANVLKKYNVEKWHELPEEVRPNYKLLVIDEFAEISPDLEPDKGEKKIKLILMRCLVMLLQKGRAVGISVVICTQRPEREVVPGILKANLPWTMALQVRNRVNSEILLDNDKAVWLRGKGRCWIQTSDFEKEVQVPYLSGKNIRQKLANIPTYYSNHTNTDKSTKKLTQTTNKKVD